MFQNTYNHQISCKGRTYSLCHVTCIQYTLSSRALGLAAFRPSAREQSLAYKHFVSKIPLLARALGLTAGPSARSTKGYLVYKQTIHNTKFQEKLYARYIKARLSARDGKVSCIQTKKANKTTSSPKKKDTERDFSSLHAHSPIQNPPVL